MSYPSLNHDRGEKRAEELRQRFRRVSNASLGRSGAVNPFAWRPSKQIQRVANKQLWFWLAVAVFTMAIALFA